MAEGRREYTAIFSIGGRVLGSFRNAINTAQARLARFQAIATGAMHALRAAAVAAGAAIGAIFGAAFTAGAMMLRRVFGNAKQQFEEAQDRAHRLQAYFMMNEEVAKKGEARAIKLVSIFKEQTEQIAKQGIVSQNMLENMAVELAAARVPPKAISQALPMMADLLAVSKGVRATEADATRLAFAVGKAIQTGMVFPLQEFHMFFTPDQRKMFREFIKVGNQKAVFELLLKVAKQFKGFNEATLSQPGAQMAKLNQELDEMSQRIGGKLVPILDDLAKAWREALPEIEPILVRSVELLGKAAAWTGRQVRDFLGPFTGQPAVTGQDWVKTLTRQGTPFTRMPMTPYGPAGPPALPAGVQAWQDLKKAVGDLATEFGRLKGNAANGNEQLSAGAQLAKWFATELEADAQTIRKLRELIAIYKGEQKGPGWYETGRQGGAQFERQFAIVWAFLQGLGETSGLKVTWDAFVTFFDSSKHTIISAIERMGDAVGKWLLAPIKFVIEEWQKLTNMVGGLMGGGTAGFMPGGGGFGGRGAGSSWGGGYMGPIGGPPGEMIGALKDVRANFADELADPEVMRAMFQRTAQEVGTGTGMYSRVAQQAFMEELFNRAASRHQSLAYAIHDPNYYPEPVFNKSVSPQVAEAYKGILGNVTAGSNLSRYATGNASGTVGFAGGPQTLAVPGNDRFGIEGPDLRWAKAMQAQTSNSVNFAPSIVINGNASEEEQKAMDSRLRDLSRDFIDDFESAQMQQRRLSYEGGY